MVEKKLGILQRMKKKIIGGTSDILSAPSRIKSARIQRQASYDTKILKNDRANKEAGYNYNPNEGDHTDPKFRTAVEAIHIRHKRGGN